jgi:hypothetical protein
MLFMSFVVYAFDVGTGSLSLVCVYILRCLASGSWHPTFGSKNYQILCNVKDSGAKGEKRVHSDMQLGHLTSI